MALKVGEREIDVNSEEGFKGVSSGGQERPAGESESRPPENGGDSGGEEAGPSEERRDPRVRCFSRRMILRMLECTDVLANLVEKQKHWSEDRKAIALKQLKWDFEMAVQENITVNGQPWQEASDKTDHPHGPDIKALEDQFDENIVETATKRKQYPRKIVTHVIKALKTEREMMGLLQTDVKPKDIITDPAQLSRMTELVNYTSATAKETTESMKSLSTLLQKAEGLSQALSMQPGLDLSKTHKEVFRSLRPREEDQVNGFFTKLQRTPTQTDAKEKSQTLLQRKRRSMDSAQSRIYLLRSKRKISLNG